MKELYTRTIWGFLFVSILATAIFLGPYTFAALFLVLSLSVLHEFYQLCKKAGYSPQIVSGMIIGGLVFILSFIIAKDSLLQGAFGYLLPLIYVLPVYELFRKTKNNIVNIALTEFGIVFVSVPFSLLNFLAYPNFTPGNQYCWELLITLFIFVWAGDSGAYLFGVSFGRHRLYEKISPKKSWEGLLGGIATAIAAAWVLTFLLPLYSFGLLASMATIVVISGTLGDLVESMIKRNVNVKDSGHFLPGHGGLLDRFDSILLATPMIYFVIQIFN